MQSTCLEPSRAAPPSLGLLTIEPLRAALEFADLIARRPRFHASGDGHPVVIFPGLGGGHRSIAPLLAFCRRLGYNAHPWGRGLNRGPRHDVNAWIEQLAHDVRQLAVPRGGTVSLIGWSLGGIYAREVAKVIAPCVRHVITIGTPFSGTPEQSHAGLAYRLLSGQRPTLDARLAARIATPPPVATTSLYSKSDGVVAWQTCVQKGDWPQVDNVEVRGSHCGLGWNREVLDIVAKRLGAKATGRSAPKTGLKASPAATAMNAPGRTAQRAHHV